MLSEKIYSKVFKTPGFYTETSDNIFLPIILGTAHTGRQDRDIIVLRHFMVRRIEYRCIPVTFSVINSCHTVVGHEHRCHTAEELEHVDMRLDPVPGPFIHESFNVGVLAVGQNTYEQPEYEVEQSGDLQMTIGGTSATVVWEDNDAVQALKELCKDQPLTIAMSMYGGFEQVGSIGTALPQDDVQTTTSAGDIVLYSGNQMVVFYGSNTWAYTRLGHISDQSADGMAELLSNGDTVITVSLG